MKQKYQQRGKYKKRKHPHRQTTRKIVLFISLLLFPITLNYFSPYVIIDGAAQGIINGSLLVFLGMFISALFVGRLWCAWLCPAGGLQEACFSLNDKPSAGGRYNWIKWGIWIPWIGIIALSAISAGGYTKVDFFHLTNSGISAVHPMSYIIYYAVVGTIFILSITAGKRAFCHYCCWMAPFMILGRQARNLAHTPASTPISVSNAKNAPAVAR